MSEKIDYLKEYGVMDEMIGGLKRDKLVGDLQKCSSIRGYPQSVPTRETIETGQLIWFANHSNEYCFLICEC